MGLLDRAEVKKLVSAALSAELVGASNRDNLMAGLPSAWWHDLPLEDSPLRQLRADVQALNLQRTLEGVDEPPLASWLDNAETLSDPLPAAQVFRKMREEVVRRAQRVEELPPVKRFVHDHRRLWPMAVVLGVLVASGFVLARPVGKAEVEFDLRTTALRVTLAETVTLSTLSTVKLRSLAARGANWSTLPDEKCDLQRGDRPPALKLVSAERGSLQLNQMVVPKGATLSIEHITDPADPEAPPLFELGFSGGDHEKVTAVAILAGGVKAYLSPGAYTCWFGEARALEFTQEPGEPDAADPDTATVLRLELMGKPDQAAKTAVAFIDEVVAAGTVEWWSASDTMAEGEEPDIQSRLLEGEVRFPDGTTRELRPGDKLRYRSIEGRVRRIWLQQDGVRVLYAGKVRKLAVGPRAASARTLMPSQLAMLRRSSLLLFGVGVLYLGLIGGAVWWWRRWS